MHNQNITSRKDCQEVLNQGENFNGSNKVVVFEDIDLEKAEDIMESRILLV